MESKRNYVSMEGVFIVHIGSNLKPYIFGFVWYKMISALAWELIHLVEGSKVFDMRSSNLHDWVKSCSRNLPLTPQSYLNILAKYTESGLVQNTQDQVTID